MGFLSDILSPITDIAAPILGFMGTQNTNSANQAIASSNNQFNAQQQADQNAWQAQQNQQAQTFSAQQAQNANAATTANMAQAQMYNDFNTNRANAFAQNTLNQTQSFNADQASKANAFTQSTLDQQEAFQANQSSTQYQRAVADMKAAGINPMLASMNGGNSAMSGSSASGHAASSSPMSGATPNFGSSGGQGGSGFAGASHGASSSGNPVMQSVVGGALNAMSSAADLKIKSETAKNIAADTENRRMDTGLKSSQILINAEIPNKIRTEIESMASTMSLQESEKRLNTFREKGILSQNQVNASLEYLNRNTGKLRDQETNTELDRQDLIKQGIKINSPYADHPYGFAMSKEGSTWLNSAASALGATRGTLINPTYSYGLK